MASSIEISEAGIGRIPKNPSLFGCFSFNSAENSLHYRANYLPYYLSPKYTPGQEIEVKEVYINSSSINFKVF